MKEAYVIVGKFGVNEDTKAMPREFSKDSSSEVTIIISLEVRFAEDSTPPIVSSKIDPAQILATSIDLQISENYGNQSDRINRHRNHLKNGDFHPETVHNVYSVAVLQ